MLEEGSGSLGAPAPAPGEAGACCFARAPAERALCCRCAHKRRASPLTCLAICFLVLSYNLLGGFLFLALEGSAAQDLAVAASKPNLSQARGAADLRSSTVERLWSITEDLNILYKENWTKLAAKELMDFQKVLIKSMRGGGAGAAGARGVLDAPFRDADYRWTFTSSFLYALTLITTIGDGGVVPRSAAGRLAAVAYACVGIPLIMLYLSTVGEALARNFRVLYSRLCPARLAANVHARADCRGRGPPPAPPLATTTTGAGHCKQYDPTKLDRHRRTPFQAALNLESFSGGGGYHWTCRDHTRVPVPLSALLIALYVALGTALFHATERWSLVDGCYFSFSSLATIGFGDLRPGRHASAASARAEDAAVAACCVYILVGIVVVAMCFNLIQEDMSGALRRVRELCARGGDTRAVHSRTADRDRWLALAAAS